VKTLVHEDWGQSVIAQDAQRERHVKSANATAKRLLNGKKDKSECKCKYKYHNVSNVTTKGRVKLQKCQQRRVKAQSYEQKEDSKCKFNNTVIHLDLFFQLC